MNHKVRLKRKAAKYCNLNTEIDGKIDKSDNIYIFPSKIGINLVRQQEIKVSYHEVLE